MKAFLHDFKMTTSTQSKNRSENEFVTESSHTSSNKESIELRIL